MLQLCFWTITISAGALALVSAIMIGFEKSTYEKLKGINADLLIRSLHKPLNYPAIQAIIADEFTTSIEAITPSSLHTLLVKVDDETMPIIVFLHAVDPQTFTQVSTLAQTIKMPDNVDFNQIAQNGIIIGKELAELLSSGVGSQITLLSPEQQQKRKNSLSFESLTTTISGIFTTGIEDIDSSMIVCSQAFAEKLFDDVQDITAIALKIKSDTSLESTRVLLQERLGISVSTWKDLYKPLVDAMELETYAMIIMLALMVGVAMMSISALLLLYISHKKNTIAILLAMGASRKLVRKIFLMVGLGVTLTASIVATAAAALISYMLNTYQLISLPTVYYVSYVPAAMSWMIVINVSMLVIFLSAAAMAYALTTVNTLPIARVLRFEF